MRPRKTKEMRSVLEKKGFIPANGDHVFLFLHVNGKKTRVRTKLSHGATEYGPPLLKLVAGQLHLTSSELDDLLDCPMSAIKYVGLLAQRGFLTG